MNSLGKFVNIKTGKLDANAAVENGQYPFFTCAVEPSRINIAAYDCECVLVAGNGDLNVKYYIGKFNAYQRTYIIESKDKNVLSPIFLFRFIDKSLRHLRSQTKGGVIQYLRLNDLNDLKIKLPEIEHQIHIANILSKAENLIAQRKESIRLLDEFLKSTFLEMFGDPVRNEKGWEKLSVSKIGESRLGKMLDTKRVIGNNLKPYLRNSNVLWFKFKLDDLLEMDFDEKDKKEFSLRAGDVLMCEGGEIGRCAIWKAELKECYFQKAIHRIRLNNLLAIPEYFVYMFRLFTSKGGLNQFMRAATISHLTGEKLKKLSLPVPPLPLQTRFAQIVEKTEALKAQYQESLREMEQLYGSLSQRAFRGS
jgi:type I restriction enzyme S subunit